MKKNRVFSLPANPKMDVAYHLMPRKGRDDFYRERTDRNIGWITRDEQETIVRKAVVGIAGCGGMGGLVAAILLRLGIGEIRIADNETFDVSNLNRQFGATIGTLGASKAFSTAQMLRDIADDTDIVVYPKGITLESADDFAQGCDIILDEVEFWAIAARIILHQAMRKYGGTILNSPTVGHRVYVFKFEKEGMTAEDVLGISYPDACILEDKIRRKTASEEEVRFVMERMLKFAAPELPEYSVDPTAYSTVEEVKKRLLNETRASIIATNPPLAAGFLANQALFHLLRKSKIERNFITPPPMPGFLMFDSALFICKKKEGII